MLRWKSSRSDSHISGLRIVCGDNATIDRSAANLVIQPMRREQLRREQLRSDQSRSERCSTTLLLVAGALFENLKQGGWNNAFPFDRPAFLDKQI